MKRAPFDDVDGADNWTMPIVLAPLTCTADSRCGHHNPHDQNKTRERAVPRVSRGRRKPKAARSQGRGRGNPTYGSSTPGPSCPTPYSWWRTTSGTRWCCTCRAGSGHKRIGTLLWRASHAHAKRERVGIHALPQSVSQWPRRHARGHPACMRSDAPTHAALPLTVLMKPDAHAGNGQSVANPKERRHFSGD